MEKIEAFTLRRGKYNWQALADEGGIWKMVAGEDYHTTDRSVGRAAYAWARRHNLVAAVSNPEPGVIEVGFSEPAPPEDEGFPE